MTLDFVGLYLLVFIVYIYWWCYRLSASSCSNYRMKELNAILSLSVCPELLDTQETASNFLFGIKKNTVLRDINGCNCFRLVNFSDFFVVSSSTFAT